MSGPRYPAVRPATGTPEDIAEVVAFLASPAGHWVNGQVLRANGGIVRPGGGVECAALPWTRASAVGDRGGAGRRGACPGTVGRAGR
ncbi:MAG: Short-chain dehydrogenase/reductase, partial [Modestobacter sp.]|nr:Short-chain dehydrogenase/reductase [Modestobacter sp.]